MFCVNICDIMTIIYYSALCIYIVLWFAECHCDDIYLLYFIYCWLALYSVLIQALVYCYYFTFCCYDYCYSVAALILWMVTAVFGRTVCLILLVFVLRCCSFWRPFLLLIILYIWCFIGIWFGRYIIDGIQYNLFYSIYSYSIIYSVSDDLYCKTCVLVWYATWVGCWRATPVLLVGGEEDDGGADIGWWRTCSSVWCSACCVAVLSIICSVIPIVELFTRRCSWYHGICTVFCELHCILLVEILFLNYYFILHFDHYSLFILCMRHCDASIVGPEQYCLNIHYRYCSTHYAFVCLPLETVLLPAVCVYICLYYLLF